MAAVDGVGSDPDDGEGAEGAEGGAWVDFQDVEPVVRSGDDVVGCADVNAVRVVCGRLGLLGSSRAHVGVGDGVEQGDEPGDEVARGVGDEDEEAGALLTRRTLAGD